VERAGWEVHDLPEHGPSTTDFPVVAAAATKAESTAPANDELNHGSSALSVEIDRLLKAAQAALRQPSLDPTHMEPDLSARSAAALAKPPATQPTPASIEPTSRDQRSGHASVLGQLATLAPALDSLGFESTGLSSAGYDAAGYDAVGVSAAGFDAVGGGDPYDWPQWSPSQRSDTPGSHSSAHSGETGAMEASSIPVRLIVTRLAAPASLAQLATSKTLLPLASDDQGLVEIRWQGRVRALGTLVAIDGRFGVRVTQLVSASENNLS
jgi:flagellar motor switch/type III secretory pathway protein FliN